MTIAAARGAQGSGAGPAVTLPQQYPPLTRTSGKLPNVRAGDMLPYGYRIRGSNLVPNPTQEDQDGGGVGRIWSRIWRDWDIAYLRLCLDDAVKLGMNTMRMLSTVGGIWAGEITRAQVHARWDQLSQECQKRGLFLYPSGVDSTLGDRFSSIPYAFLEAEIVAWAAHMHTLPDIIGLDLVTESAGSFGASANAVTLYNAVKAVTDLPCTYSCTSQPDVNNLTPTYRADRQDYFDFHTYNYVPDQYSTFNVDNYWSGGGTRPIMVGEYGKTDDEGGVAAYYAANRHLAEYVTPGGHRGISGLMSWCIIDFSHANVLGGHGAFDINNVEKATQGSNIRRVPRT